jgi:hypothetical protein
MAAEEGRPKRYTHFTDEFIVGDTLNILVTLRPNDTLWLKLEDLLRDEVLVGALHSVENIRYWDEDMDYLTNDSKDFLGKFGIEPNKSIMVENTLVPSKIYLERYYKDDWQGLFKKGNELTAQVAILDCRVSGRSNLAEITDRLKAVVKKWDE